MHRQTKFARSISRLSPSAIYLYATSTLASTDLSAYENFMRRLRLHREKYEEAILISESGGKVNPEEYEFLFVPESIQDSLRSALPDICLLILINILLFMMANLFFMRYEV